MSVEKNNNVLENLEIDYLPVDSIKPNSYNPNRQSEHDFELLCKSIQADGFTQPIVVLKESKTIVDGEHRWRACKALGHKEVPCVLVDMTEEQMRIATLRHNRARGKEVQSLAADVLRSLAAEGALDFAKDELGLDNTEVSRLLADSQAIELESLNADVGEDLLGPDGKGLTDGDRETGVDTEADQTRAKERLLAAAKSAEEKAMSDTDRSYRLTLMYTETEAKVVKGILGSHKAEISERLLHLCRDEEARLKGASA
jgi:ParB/RepB/Spo0J family partition protein